MSSERSDAESPTPPRPSLFQRRFSYPIAKALGISPMKGIKEEKKEESVDEEEEEEEGDKSSTTRKVVQEKGEEEANEK